MPKVKLTKGELKGQRDSLQQYQRYLPILQLKKQQLQLEILHQLNLLGEKRSMLLSKKRACLAWSGLLAEQVIDLRMSLSKRKVKASTKNIAGVDISLFEGVEFQPQEYDLFILPLWLDAAVEFLKGLASLQEEIKVIERAIQILRQELRITTQRVNLFEKVKIPEAQVAIRLIKIYIGDQMANAVGRSKIAKNKIEEVVLEEALA